METWIFFGVVFMFFGLVNYYVFLRGLQAMGLGKRFKIVYGVVFWILAASYFVGSFMKQSWAGAASMGFIWAGSFWLGALLYFVLFAILFDIIRLIHKITPIIPEKVHANYPRLKRHLLSAVVLFVALLLAAGHINARFPVVRNLSVSLPYAGKKPAEFSMLVISDIHMGPKMGVRQLNRIVELANRQNPEIILLAGDIIDEDIDFLKRLGLKEALSKLHAPYGVFGVMGNHEYISGGEDAYAFLTANGVKVLRDTTIRVKELFYLIGREDFQKRTFVGVGRKDLSELMKLTTDGFPVVVLDHQPVHPEAAAREGAHLMISGHTHHGQLWPLNFVTRAIYTLSFGHKVVEGMHLVVSNGIGTWGPPVRIGNRPEMVLIDVAPDPATLNPAHRICLPAII